MDAKELRIGNLIYRVGHVSEVGWETLKLCSQRNIQFNKDFSPIPLSEEWLLKFGFEIQKSPRYKEWLQIFKGNFFMQKIEGDDYWSTSLEYDHDSSYKIGQIRYVHQIQNLYVALIGEELKCITTSTKH